MFHGFDRISKVLSTVFSFKSHIRIMLSKLEVIIMLSNGHLIIEMFCLQAKVVGIYFQSGACKYLNNKSPGNAKFLLSGLNSLIYCSKHPSFTFPETWVFFASLLLVYK